VDQRIVLRTVNESKMSRCFLIDPFLSRHFGGVFVELVRWLKCERNFPGIFECVRDSFLAGSRNFVTSGRLLYQCSIINPTSNSDRDYIYDQKGTAQENLSTSILQQYLGSCHLVELIMVLAKSKNAVGLGNRFVSPNIILLLCLYFAV
jgi:hypothetical protein